MGGCSLRNWLQKDAYIVLGSLHLSTDALRNRKPELCPGLSVCICRQDVNVIIKNMIYGKPNKDQLPLHKHKPKNSGDQPTPHLQTTQLQAHAWHP
ncbi:hypothetical protein Taro_008815 [Colocasia esculenta]|uniref:Uncharacterized protein n=1 Tax=Colocasia esculenta TaxID=4460 RepID=A0A843TZ92_COLES|nr:hypothetical protein [Colocasia esculenta]